jgi:superfamily II DNA/RNA helicase
MKGDFEDEIKRIARLLPNSRQNLMFTATFPDTLRPIVRHIMRAPAIINMDEALDEVDVDQHVVTVNRDKKNDLLAYLLNENDWQQVLIFCSAKRTCDNLVIKLAKRGIAAVAMHGNKEQSARMAALRDFKSGKTRILIATDVAARGIDIEYLPCVINFDLPRSPNDYIHRIGRTARAGRPGQAITLISHDEYQHFGVIEKRNGFRLEREQVEGFEADEVAPVMPKRNGTRKKLKAKGKSQAAKKKQRGQRGDGSKKGAKANKPDAAAPQTPFKWPERKPG